MKIITIQVLLTIIVVLSFSINISQVEYERIIHKLKDLAILENQTPTFEIQPIKITMSNGKLIIPQTVEGTMTLGYIVYNFNLQLPIEKDTISTSKVSISPALIMDLKSFQGFGVNFNYNLNKLGGGIFLDEWGNLAPKFLDKILDYLDSVE